MPSQYPAYGASQSTLTNSSEHAYPPSPYGPSSVSTLTAPAKPDKPDNDAIARDLARTPSPTPSEARELKTGAIDWRSMANWKFWIRKEWTWYYVALVIIVAITALMTIYHKQIVQWLTPATNWLHDFSFGWVVPIAVLFIISFPPLFGHEIVAVLCGLVWGLWIGFGIVAAGTFLGEVGNFYAFKYCCRSRGEKLERTKISYACLAKVVRDGGFKIALIARLSAIPGHFTTAVFSTCGMGIFVFSIAALLSMPKQFITVYLGVILEQSESGTPDQKSQIISRVVLSITVLITIAAMWYILRQMNKVKPEVIYARRKARQAKLARAQLPYGNPDGMSSDGTLTHDPEQAEVTTPLSPTHKPQQPSFGQVYAPQSQRHDAYTYNPYTKDEELAVDDYSYQQPLTHNKPMNHDPARLADENSDDGHGIMGGARGHAPLPPGIPPAASLRPPNYSGSRPESYIITFDPSSASQSPSQSTTYLPNYSNSNTASQPGRSPFEDAPPQPSQSTPNLHSNAALDFSAQPKATYTPQLPSSSVRYPDPQPPPPLPQPYSSAGPPPLPSTTNSAQPAPSNPYFVRNMSAARGVALSDNPAPAQSNNSYLSTAGHAQEETGASYYTAVGSSPSPDASPRRRPEDLR